MAEINTLHPFREGNGRTQRVFFEELARRARFQITFADIEPETLLKADIEAYAIYGGAAEIVRDIAFTHLSAKKPQTIANTRF